MTVTKPAISHAAEVAFIRFQVPDLEHQQIFLQDFGITSTIVSDADGRRLYGTGANGRSFLYIAEEGEPKFLGLGLEVSSREELEALAELEDASSIQPIEGAADGEWVRFTDPNGFKIDAVFGQKLTPEPEGPKRPAYNMGFVRSRLSEPVRLSRGPARVMRIGHCVLDVIDFHTSEAWYKERFGFLTTDEIYAGDEGNTIGAFLRCNLGDTPTDHHTIFLVDRGTPGLNHVAFEVESWDAVMLGHDYLEEKGYEQHWGVGKHILGSQVFDYWKDPYGNVVEHYTDGDVFTADLPPKREPVEVLMGVQWGPKSSGGPG